MTFPLYALQTDSSTSFAGFTKTVQMIFYILPSGRAIISLEEAGIVHFPASL
jgi:hypothetical protein